MKGPHFFDVRNYEEVLDIATEHRDVFFSKNNAVGTRLIYDTMDHAPEEVKREFEDFLVPYHFARTNGLDHLAADEFARV